MILKVKTVNKYIPIKGHICGFLTVGSQNKQANKQLSHEKKQHIDISGYVTGIFSVLGEKCAEI